MKAETIKTLGLHISSIGCGHLYTQSFIEGGSLTFLWEEVAEDDFRVRSYHHS